MKSKKEVRELLLKALGLLKQQVLIADDLKVRTRIQAALDALNDAEDDDAPKSQAV